MHFHSIAADQIKVARTLRFAPGTILAIDRGYVDYEWFRVPTQEEVYFVTRMKEKAVYEVHNGLLRLRHGDEAVEYTSAIGVVPHNHPCIVDPAGGGAG